MNPIKIIEGEIKITNNPSIAILASRFNHTIVQSLAEGAIAGLTQHGVDPAMIHLYRVPGAMELPLLAQKIAKHHDGCIALGAVIRGDTPHFDYVAGECARGLSQISLAMNKPIIFGVLTTNTLEQAQARSGKTGNKGFDAALNLIEMLNLFNQLK